VGSSRGRVKPIARKQAFEVAMVTITQRNKRSFQEIERIRDALNNSICIFF
jgi:predicted Co/Zn/Cd cation transporter (cation efflux family)